MKQRTLVAVTFFLLLMSSFAFSQDNGRTQKFSFPLTITGYLMGHCGNFDVLTDYVILLSGTILYDKSGVPVQQIQKIRTLGESVYYNSTDPDKSVLGGPAEVEQDRIDLVKGLIYLSGPSFKVRVPGYGLIFAQIGLSVYDLNTGQLLFNSGLNQLGDQDVAALCNYLK